MPHLQTGYKKWNFSTVTKRFYNNMNSAVHSSHIFLSTCKFGLTSSNATPPQPFYGALFQVPPGWVGTKENFWTLWCKERLIEADTQTIRLSATLTRLISNPPPSSPNFYSRSPSCRNSPSLSWLWTCTKYAGLHTQWRGFMLTVGYMEKRQKPLIHDSSKTGLIMSNVR